MGATTNSPQEIREKLANSLVMVGEIGGNDYNYAFVVNKPVVGAESSIYSTIRGTIGAVEAMALVPGVVQSILSTAKEVLEMGATRMVIPGNFPLGCVPSYLSAASEEDLAAYDGSGCLIGLNLFAQMHNVLLQQGVRELRESYPSATIAYADYFAAYVQMAQGRAQDGLRRGGGDQGVLRRGRRRVQRGRGQDVRRARDDGVREAGRVHQLGRRPPDAARLQGQVMSELLYHRGLASPAPVNFPRL
ncbi:hypothetical protein ACQ4PT_057159 [Festuca glaucescens]